MLFNKPFGLKVFYSPSIFEIPLYYYRKNIPIDDEKRKNEYILINCRGGERERERKREREKSD
jgi:hypothetical protein